jgi:hypothetical protein
LLGFEFRRRAARAPVAKVSKKLCQWPFAIKLQAQLNEISSQHFIRVGFVFARNPFCGE